jgi:excisionase family DNA binding protein
MLQERIMNDSAISVAVIAKRLDVCERTARRIIEAGDLKAHRIRRQWRVFEADFQEYLAGRTNRRDPQEGQT